MVTHIMVLTSLQTDQPLSVIIIAMIMMLSIKLIQQYNYELFQTNQPWAPATNAWESTPTLGAVALFKPHHQHHYHNHYHHRYPRNYHHYHYHHLREPFKNVLAEFVR